MKIIKRLCMVCYLIVAVVAGISFFAKDIGDGAIKEAVIYSTISSKVGDVILQAYPDVTTDQLLTIYDDINENEFLNDITQEYIQAIEITVAEDGNGGNVADHINTSDVESSISNLSDEIVKIITDTSNLELGTMQKAIIQSVTKYLSQNIQSKITESCNKVVNYMTPDVINAVKIYIAITSTTAQIILAIILVVLTILIIVMNSVKTRAVFDLGISSLCGGILTCVTAFAAKSLSLSLTNKLLGRSITINVAPLFMYAIVLMGIGAVLVGVWVAVLRRR